MQKCKQCEWEFPDDMRECPYCGHPVEPEDKKQKRRFNLRWHPNTLMGRVNNLLLVSHLPDYSYRSFQEASLVSDFVSTITVILLGGTLIMFVWARGSTQGVPAKSVISNSTPPPANSTSAPFCRFWFANCGIEDTASNSE